MPTRYVVSGSLLLRYYLCSGEPSTTYDSRRRRRTAAAQLSERYDDAEHVTEAKRFVSSSGCFVWPFAVARSHSLLQIANHPMTDRRK